MHRFLAFELWVAGHAAASKVFSFLINTTVKQLLLLQDDPSLVDINMDDLVL